MPDYDRRKSELRDRLREVTPQLKDNEAVRITAALEGIFNTRDAALTALAASVADRGKDELAPDYRQKLDSFHRQISQLIEAGLSGLSGPSDAARIFFERLDREEDAFFVLLGAADAGGTRDALLVQQRNLEAMIDVLERKWQRFTEEDRRVEEAEEQAATQVREIISKAIADGVPAALRITKGLADLSDSVSVVKRSINEWVAAFARGVGVPEGLIQFLSQAITLSQELLTRAAEQGIPAATVLAVLPLFTQDVGGFIAEHVKQLLDPHVQAALRSISVPRPLLEVVNSAYYSQIQAYRGQLSNQGALLVSFSSTRRDTDEFVRRNGPEMGRPGYERTLSALAAWASSSGLTDGQRADAADVVAEMRGGLVERWAKLIADFEAFFNRYRGRFLGAVSNQTEQEIIRTERWQVTMNGLVGLGLEERVRQWRETVNTVNVVPKRSFDEIQDIFLGLPIEIQDRVRRAVNDYLDGALRTLNTEAEQTAKALESSTLLLNAQKISNDFDRRALVAALRA